MADAAADLIMTLIFLAATELAAGTFKGQNDILPKAIDALASHRQVCEAYLDLLV